MNILWGSGKKGFEVQKWTSHKEIKILKDNNIKMSDNLPF